MLPGDDRSSTPLRVIDNEGSLSEEESKVGLLRVVVDDSGGG